MYICTHTYIYIYKSHMLVYTCMSGAGGAQFFLHCRVSVPTPDLPGGNPGANGCFFSQLSYKCDLEEVASVGD